MARRFSESYEVLILPKNSPNTRRLVIKGRTIRTAIWSVVLLFVFIAAGFAALGVYAHLKPDKKQLAALADENIALKKRMYRIMQKVTLLENRLNNVENFEVQLRRLTQVHDPKRQLAMGPVSEKEFLASLTGSSQSGKFNEALLLKLQQTLGTSDIDAIESKLDELIAGVQGSEEKLAELTAYVRDQKFMLSHIPSIRPTHGWITSGFGVRVHPFTHTQQFHEGLDIANAVGTPIIAPADGVVTFVGEKDGYGKTLIIDHQFGIQTLYGHLSEFWVSIGDTVKRGQKIAAMGNTGRSTGPHLHYEVRVHGIPRNPMYYIVE